MGANSFATEVIQLINKKLNRGWIASPSLAMTPDSIPIIIVGLVNPTYNLNIGGSSGTVVFIM